MSKVSIYKISFIFFVIVIIGTGLVVATLIFYQNYRQKSYVALSKNAIIKPVKVFQIGFSKCGTTSIADFFIQNGVPTIHHDFGILAQSIYDNAKAGKPLLDPHYEQFAIFTDMERAYEDQQIQIPIMLFKELDQQYPGSKFILNTRDKQAWLKSRSKHYMDPIKKITLLADTARMLNISEQQVLEQWSKEWDAHHAEVLEYFKNRPNDLLVFNIEHDPPQNIVRFLHEYFRLDAKLFGHKNKTHALTKVDEEKVSQVELFNKDYLIVATQ